MDDGGNNNGNAPNEREASLRLNQQKRLQLQREFQNISLLLLYWTREEAVVLHSVHERNKQRWQNLFKLITELIGARATIVFLFQTIKYNRSNYNREREDVDEDEDEDDEDEDEDEEEITTILDIFRGITGTVDTVLSMLKALECKENTTPTMDINTALLLAIKKHNEGILQLDCIYYLLKQKQSMIQNCQMIFTEAIRGNINYYDNSNHPIETGIVTIFTANDTHRPLTIFQKACNRLGRKSALQMLEETLQRSSRKIDTVRALLYAATKNSNHEQRTVVHLDCSYFLLRRQPDVLANLLSSSQIIKFKIVTTSRARS